MDRGLSTPLVRCVTDPRLSVHTGLLGTVVLFPSPVVGGGVETGHGRGSWIYGGPLFNHLLLSVRLNGLS